MRGAVFPVGIDAPVRFRLSVLIATYGRPAALKAAVESLVRQTRPPDEVVIAMWSDDGPTASVVDELVAYANAEPGLPSIRVVHTPENTVCAKENAAMRTATGDILCFMDDDAKARPGWLQSLERLYGDPSVGAVGGRDMIWKDGKIWEKNVSTVGHLYWFGRLLGNHHERTFGVREVDFLKGVNMSFRREVMSPIDPRLIGEKPYGFEIDMGLAVRARGYRVLYDPQVVVDHFSASNMSAKQLGLARVSNHNLTYILLKHLPWNRRIAFLLYTFLVGDKGTIGLLRVPWLVWREHWTWKQVVVHFAAKIRGIRSFWAWLRAGR